MIAAPEAPPAGSAMEGQQAGQQADGATPASDQDLKKHLKKRKLYRQATHTTEVWFPHDNAKDLMKELVWEAGGGDVKWVCHGTAVAGNGIVGLLEVGCNVLTLCEDDHHKTHFMNAAVEKAAETCLGGRSPTFGNPALLLRARELNLVKEIPKDDKEKEKDKEEPKGEVKEEPKEEKEKETKGGSKPKKKKEKKKPKADLPVAKKQKVEKSSSSSSSSASSGS